MISVKGTVAESLSGTRETNQICDVDTKFVKIFYDSASSLVYDCSKKGSIRFSISTSRNTRFYSCLLVVTRKNILEEVILALYVYILLKNFIRRDST